MFVDDRESIVVFVALHVLEVWQFSAFAFTILPSAIAPPHNDATQEYFATNLSSKAVLSEMLAVIAMIGNRSIPVELMGQSLLRRCVATVREGSGASCCWAASCIMVYSSQLSALRCGAATTWVSVGFAGLEWTQHHRQTSHVGRLAINLRANFHPQPWFAVLRWFYSLVSLGGWINLR